MIVNWKEYEPNLPPLAPIEQNELGNKYRLNEARDGYIVETLYAKDDAIEVPEMFIGLPVVELGNMAFTWNTEAWKAIIPASVKKRGISRSMLAMKWVMQNTEVL